jgi:hypothetical protein
MLRKKAQMVIGLLRNFESKMPYATSWAMFQIQGARPTSREVFCSIRSRQMVSEQCRAD